MTRPPGLMTLLVATSGLLGVVLSACDRATVTRAPSTNPAATLFEAGVGRPNIILISIDSLRADHLGCYGYARGTSPAIDGLAAEGVLFEHAVAQAPWTLPSHASLLTALYSRTHGVSIPKRRLPPDATTLASVLRSAGYHTHAIVSGPFMQARFGLDAGFDTYDERLARCSHRQSHGLVTSSTIHRRAVKLLSTLPQPFFLFLHYWDVHYDYVPPAPYDTRFDPDYGGSISPRAFMFNPAIHEGMAPRDLEHLVALYDGEIAWVDEHIGKLLAELRKQRMYDRALIVLTADHGDEFFEHGQKGHQHSLYQELVHVPLIMRLPGPSDGARYGQRVQLIDVMPTLLDALRVTQPAALQGRSLWPLLCEQPWSAGPVVSETAKARKGRRERQKCESWCLCAGRHKLITFAADRYPPELYDLEADPGEQRNLIGSGPDAPLIAQLEFWKEQTPKGGATLHGGLDEDTFRTLEALGYISEDD